MKKHSFVFFDRESLSDDSFFLKSEKFVFLLSLLLELGNDGGEFKNSFFLILVHTRPISKVDFDL